MGYDCSFEIREATKELLEPLLEFQLKERMESLENLQDAITANMSLEEMVELLALNKIDADGLCISKDGVSMSVLISDAIVNGVCSKCPVCEWSGLTQCAGRITCLGFVDGMKKCVYKTKLENVKRFRFRLTPTLQQAAWLVGAATSWTNELVEAYQTLMVSTIGPTPILIVTAVFVVAVFAGSDVPGGGCCGGGSGGSIFKNLTLPFALYSPKGK